MAATVNATKLKVIDTIDTLDAMLEEVRAVWEEHDPLLFIDLKGENLGRYGTLHVLSLYCPPKKAVYLVDVTRLGSLTFSRTNYGGISIQNLLESAAVAKALFDVRGISDVLFNVYNSPINGVRDVQLMELASREGSKDFLAQFAHLVLQEGTDEDKHRFLNPARTLDDFGKRPMQERVIELCAGDVSRNLPRLYKAYETKLAPPDNKFWRVEVESATKAYIELSRSPNYNPSSNNDLRGPWTEEYIEQARDDWNEDVMFEAMWGDEDPERDAWNDEILWQVMHGEDDDIDYHNDSPPDTARDCDGWEEDMIRNGSPI